MNKTHAIGLASLFVVSAAGFACGGGGMPSALPTPPAAPTAPGMPAAPTASAPASAAAPASASAAAPAPSAAPWDSLNHDQKLEIMKTQVLPQMKALFQAQDAKKFADFTCKTCHGEDAKQNKFAMPNDKLPKIPADFSKWLHDKPEMVKFMDTKVVPTMASIVGEKPYDPQTKEGFGCTECHTKGK